jgi:hypothetical protein
MNDRASGSGENREVAARPKNEEPEKKAPKKKEAPNPLPRAVEQGAPVRALSPLRKLGLPLGIAAVVALGGGAAAYAISSANEHTRSTRSGGTFAIDVPDVLHAVTEFIAPDRAPPRLAGEVAPVTPSSSVAAPPAPPTAAPTASSPKPPPTVIEPHHPPRLAGAIAPPKP